MYPYENVSLMPKARAADLLDRMSLEEKMGQVVGFFYQPFGSEELEQTYPHGVGNVSCLEMRSLTSLEECVETQRRLQERIMALSEHHIPAIFHMEGLCGAYLQGAASFPSGLGRASSWDPALEEEIGTIVGRQERAAGITQTLAPVLDVSRDPRMGRQGETYGEDPTLIAALGTAFVRGLQKEDTHGIRTEAVAKHFLGFHASQGGIHGADCSIGPRTLREVYAKPFQAAITDAGLRGIMPCYCAIDGEPVSASKAMLTGLLREEMGFDGITVSDYGAVGNIRHVQKLCDSDAEAGLRAMDAGMDMELQFKRCFSTEMENRFASGAADISVLDNAVRRILEAKFRMGLFEHPYALTGIELKECFTRGNEEAASLQSARESLVLLKNNGILPLAPDVKEIAVIGWHAGTARSFYGGYTHFSMVEGLCAALSTMAGLQTETGTDTTTEYIPGTRIQQDDSSWDDILRRQDPGAHSLVEELRRYTKAKITYAQGYSFAGTDCSGFQEALDLTRQADVVIVTLGGKYGTGSIASTGEGIDSASIGLPPCQEQFLLQLKQLGKASVGIHFDGRPISSDVAEECLDAIIEAWAPARSGAQAIAETLTGRWNPSGKLPVSVAYHAGQIPVYYNHPNGSSYHQGESIAFHDYVDLTHRPRYPFGYGLSYTQFKYIQMQISAAKIKVSEQLEVTVMVKNTGSAEGDEVVQLYVRDEFASMLRPVKELAGFSRVHLLPGEEKTVTFVLDPTQLAFLDRENRWFVESGSYTLYAGSSSEELPLTAGFAVEESAFISGKNRSFYAHMR